MPNIYFPIGQTATRNFSSDQSIIVTLPETIRPTLIVTPVELAVPYIEQSLLDLDVLVEFGSPRDIASKIGKDFYLAVQANWKRNLVWLRQEVQALKTDMPKRAQPFLDYAVNAEALSYEGSRALQATLEVNSYGPDLDKLLDPVYIALGVNLDLTEPHLKAVGNYIHTGFIDQQTLDFLVGADHVFGRLKQYSSLEAELQQAEAAPEPTLKDTQKYLFKTIRAIKSGEEYEPDFYGANLLPYLEKLVGTPPSKQFIARVNEAKYGINGKGLLAPLFYNGSDIPEEFKPIFLHPQRLAQIAIYLDLVLDQIVRKYAISEEKIDEIAQEHKGLELDIGLLMRSLMPENSGMFALYPNERVLIEGKPDLSKRLESIASEAYATGKLVRLAAPHFNMNEEELSQGLDKLISVQNHIMPLIPIDYYRFLALDKVLNRIKDALADITEKIEEKRSTLDYTSPSTLEQFRVLIHEHNNLANRHNSVLRRNKSAYENIKDFGIDPLVTIMFDETVIDDTVRLFGEQLRFIENIISYWRERKDNTEENS